MKKTIDVTALGELLIDFNEIGANEQGSPQMEANPGGAPCNVLAMLCKLGRRTAFIGKVGKDQFGDQLETALQKVGIDSSGLIRDPKVHTTLAFVHNKEDGDREFSFYRDPGADRMLTVAEVQSNRSLIEQSRIFHFGTLSMTHEECREATRSALAIAEETGVLRSFDPNLREPLWNSLETAREQTLYGLAHCDILKISDNEIEWLFGDAEGANHRLGNAADRREADVIAYYGSLAQRLKCAFPSISLVTVSMGKRGSLAFCGDSSAFVPSFLRPDTVDTTGAGDTFGACVLHYVLSKLETTAAEKDSVMPNLNETELKEMLTFANAAASLVTTRKGALLSMPEKNEIEDLLNV